VALIGIGTPIALSFVLMGLLNVTPLQAFAAGAALCSTSLGTTFTVLSTSGLSDSRLGVVLSSAAMMDDVVGLIMVKVISVLGESSSSFNAVTVVRPLLVSMAFAILLPLICIYIVKPLTLHGGRMLKNSGNARLQAISTAQGTLFVLHTAVLLVMVTGSTYAGTSNLFAAYLSGLIATWWSDLFTDIKQSDQQTSHPNSRSHEPQDMVPENVDDGFLPIRAPTVANDEPDKAAADGPAADNRTTAVVPDSTGKLGADLAAASDHTTATESPTSATEIHEHYYAPTVQSILKPFFFASIGFSIPITQMFAGGIVWRGFVYAVLMIIGKMVCGVCLIRISIPSPPTLVPAKLNLLSRKLTSCWPGPKTVTAATTSTTSPQSPTGVQAAGDRDTSTTQRLTSNWRPRRATLPKPRSLYPSAILGMAMVARGEIGFLISAVAESSGVYGTPSESGSSELFLVVTWAILLCTILGPLSVGILAKRARRLQETERRTKTGRQDPLGIWGVVQTVP